jgi:hypothetical protein
VFAVDLTTWPRCDAECSPCRGYYYHPSRHSAGQPIIAGWAYQWIAQLGLERDSWTAPVDATRLHESGRSSTRVANTEVPENHPGAGRSTYHSVTVLGGERNTIREAVKMLPTTTCIS